MDRDEGYSAFVSSRRPGLVRSAVLLGCAPQEAEDVTQTALVRCYTAWDKVVRAGDQDAYVYRILVNCLAKSRRRRWWGERPTDRLPERAGDGDAAEIAVVAAVVRDALARLDDRQRQVLVLRFFADLSERQVAEVLRLPIGTVKSRTSRGLTQLASDASLADFPGHRRT